MNLFHFGTNCAIKNGRRENENETDGQSVVEKAKKIYCAHTYYTSMDEKMRTKNQRCAVFHKLISGRGKLFSNVENLSFHTAQNGTENSFHTAQNGFLCAQNGRSCHISICTKRISHCTKRISHCTKRKMTISVNNLFSTCWERFSRPISIYYKYIDKYASRFFSERKNKLTIREDGVAYGTRFSIGKQGSYLVQSRGSNQSLGFALQRGTARFAHRPRPSFASLTPRLVTGL